MKKKYNKPFIVVESLQLDSPVASTCDAQGKLNYKEAKDFWQVFTAEDSCTNPTTKDWVQEKLGYLTANVMTS